jgi:hypothetical protein
MANAQEAGLKRPIHSLINHKQSKHILVLETISNKYKEKNKWKIKTEVKEETLAQEKCTKQLVPNVVLNVKFRSNQLKASLCIVEIVIEKEETSNSLGRIL